MVAVGVGQLERLDDGVNIGRLVVAQGLEVEAVEDIEGLGYHRPLAPGAAGVVVDVAEGGLQGGQDLDPELGQVVGRHPAAVLGVVSHHGGGDVALVESMAGRLEAGFAAALGRRRALLVRPVLDGAAQVLLAEQLAEAGGWPPGR